MYKYPLMKKRAKIGDDADNRKRSTHRSNVDSRGDTYVDHDGYGRVQEAFLTEREKAEAHYANDSR